MGSPYPRDLYSLRNTSSCEIILCIKFRDISYQQSQLGYSVVVEHSLNQY